MSAKEWQHLSHQDPEAPSRLRVAVKSSAPRTPVASASRMRIASVLGRRIGALRSRCSSSRVSIKRLRTGGLGPSRALIMMPTQGLPMRSYIDRIQNGTSCRWRLEPSCVDGSEVVTKRGTALQFLRPLAVLLARAGAPRVASSARSRTARLLARVSKACGAG